MPGPYRYSRDVLDVAVQNSSSVMGVLRYLGRPLAGGNHTHISKKILEFQLDTSHFTNGRDANKGKTFPEYRKPKELILVMLPEGSGRPRRELLLRSLIELGVEYKCSLCEQLPFWNNDRLVLEVDHKDGNWLNNLASNLRFLCPNCHSQQTMSNKPHKDRTTAKKKKANGPRNVCECGVSCYGKMCKECRLKVSTKITWPSNQELLDRLSRSNYTKLAKELGITDNAIRRRLRRNTGA